MTELLTTKELQEILQIDRTTIYRMADKGRLPAVRVGNQWRFPRQQVEAWLHQQGAHGSAAPSPATAMDNGDIADLLPLQCVQLIQDTFADALGVMILVTDLQGKLVTRPSNPCGLFAAAEAVPSARQRCLELWVMLGQDPSLTPRFQRSHLGLLCARGLIRVGSEIKAMLVVGGIAPEPWPPGEEEIQQMAEDLGLQPSLIREHLDEVYRLSPDGQARLLPYVQRIADIFAHIAGERHELFGRLQRIAEITRL